MNRLYWIIAVVSLTTCSQNNRTASSEEVEYPDSIWTTTTLGQQEQATWEFFQELEAELRRQGKVKEDDMETYIQSMINNGLIERPAIFQDTENGTEATTVDYVTYKKFRLKNRVDPDRLYVMKPEDAVQLKDSLQGETVHMLIVDSLASTQ